LLKIRIFELYNLIVNKLKNVMTINQILLLLLTGTLAGFVSGAMGVGGAIIVVPFLVFFLGLTQHEAQGTSLAVLLLPVGIFAVINYAKNGLVNYKFAAILIISFVIGSYVGSVLAIHIPDKIMQKSFALLLIIVGVKMFFGK
jgi:uncharacterized membrane protein YfcA